MANVATEVEKCPPMVYTMTIMAKKRAKAPKASVPHNPWPGRLDTLRTHYDITQREAAEKLGVPLASWQNWEQGHRGVSPAIARLIQLTFPEFFRKT